MLNTDSRYLLDLLLKNGKITEEDVERAVINEMEMQLLDNNISIPVIGQRQKGGVTQYYTTMPSRYSRTGKRHQIVASSELEVHDMFVREACESIKANILTRQREELTVADGMKMYLDYLKPHEGGIKGKEKNSTLSRYYRIYKNYVKDTEFGNLLLNDVKLYHCEDFVQRLYETGIVEQSVRGIKSLVNCTFIFLESHDFPIKNYMQAVKINPALCSVKNRREVGVWEDEEIKKLCSASIKLWTKNKYRYSALIFVMLFLGCRIGEISGTTWDDIDFEKRLIHINKTYTEYQDYDTGKKCRVPDTTKNTSSTRTIKINDDAMEWLLEIKRRNEACGIDSKYIVVTRNGIVPTQSALDVSFARFCKAAGVPYKSSHTNRRTHVTTLLDAGVSVAEVSHNVGHKKTSTTLDSYYKCKAQNNDAFVAAQNNAFNAAYGNVDPGDNDPTPPDSPDPGTAQSKRTSDSEQKPTNIIDFGDVVAARRKNLATAGNTPKLAT